MNDFGIAVSVLRLLRGWSREQLARAAGMDVASIARYEQGGNPRPRTVERIRQAFGLSPASWRRLLHLIADFRQEMAEISAIDTVDTMDDAEPIEEMLAALAPRIFGALASLSAPAKTLLPPRPGAADRKRADQLWARLRPLSTTDRRALIAEGEEFFHWALAERLSLESEKIAPDRADEALALAEMADRIAERAPMPPKFRDLLRSLTTASLGNAQRFTGHARGAEAAFRRSDELWKSGAGGDPAGLLDGSRRLRVTAVIAQNA